MSSGAERCLRVLGEGRGVLAFLPLVLVVEAGLALSCGCGCLPCSVWASDTGDGSEMGLTAPHPLSFCTPSWHRGTSTKDISELLGCKTSMLGCFLTSLCEDEEWAISSGVPCAALPIPWLFPLVTTPRILLSTASFPEGIAAPGGLMFQPCHSCLVPLSRHLLPHDVPKAGHRAEPHTVFLVCTVFHGGWMQ